MKLRKKQIKLPKNFSVPRWIFANPSKEKSDFLKGVVSESSECARVPRTNNDLSGRRGRVTVVGTHDLCVRPRQNHDAVTFDTTVTVTFDTTDALRLDTPVRPYTRYSSRASPHWTIRTIAPIAPIAPIALIALMAPIPPPSNL